MLNIGEEQFDTGELPVALTIAGSDSGGGAGLQADLKTFSALSVFGTCAVTCVTAQNPETVYEVEPISPEMVSLQIKAVAESFPIAAMKTGMLFSPGIIQATAETLNVLSPENLVVDPVMIATSGKSLIGDKAVEALTEYLFPLARVITPNLPEAEVLCGRQISTIDELIEAARELGARFDVACIAKGGHLDGYGNVYDVLYENGNIQVLDSPHINAVETHGTGCTFAAAVTALLASGKSLPDAFSGAKQFVADALKNPYCTGKHYPLGITMPLRMMES